MDNDSIKDADSGDCDYCMSDVNTKTKEVFKKPVFIGPRKGFKGTSKKFSDSNESSEGEGKKDIPCILVLKPEPLSNLPSFPYNEPNWKGLPSDDYFLEVIIGSFKLCVKENLTFLIFLFTFRK